jgi:hypothetical protein
MPNAGPSNSGSPGDSMRSRLAVIHPREADGSLTPLPDMQLPPEFGLVLFTLIVIHWGNLHPMRKSRPRLPERRLT